MIYFQAVLVLFSLCYLLFAFMVISGWRKSGTYVTLDNFKDNHVFITVLVPFRNESDKLENLADSLSHQNYPEHEYEVIFVNDHSEDTSEEILAKYVLKNRNISLIKLAPGQHGKKEALLAGMNLAKGEIIAMTDADCIPGENWTRVLSQFYSQNDKPDLIIGLVDFLPENEFMSTAFRLEFISLVIAGAGLANINKPVYCNGANLAVKRCEYKNILELNPENASGDDVFLLHSLKRKKKRIKVLFSNEHLIKTKAPATFSEFLNQRIRWTSKATSYKDTHTLILSFFIFLFNLLLFGTYMLAFFTGMIVPAILLYTVKLVADIAVFCSSSKFFSVKKLLRIIPLVELVYPIYIVITPLLAIKKPFEWKGRIYQK